MLNFITGVPGSGKSLFTLWMVEKLRKESGRTVYYFNIPISKEKLPDWQELKVGEEWHLLPKGSIVVMDEAQKVFRERSKASSVPPHVAAFEEHRHDGYDVFLITQHPQLIDLHVRQLAGKHYFLKRLMGTERAHVYEWLERVVSNPNSKSEWKDARDYFWNYPKEVYSWYTSADMHFVKKDLPWRQFAWIGAGLLFVTGCFAWVFWTWIPEEEKGAQSVSESGAGERGADAPAAAPARRSLNPWEGALRRPRVQGLPSSAPMYDQLQRVASQPAVAGCMRLDYSNGKIDCRCTSSQGSVLDMTVRQCMQLVKRGWFDPTKPAVDVKAENIARLNARDGAGAGVVVRDEGAVSKSPFTGAPLPAS